jgi:hypothetical protein
MDIAGHVVVPKSNEFDPVRFEPSRAPLVFLSLLFKIVLAAIEFDGQAERRAVKVEPVRSDRMLSSEIQTR